jgi:hypothetical protein
LSEVSGLGVQATLKCLDSDEEGLRNGRFREADAKDLGSEPELQDRVGGDDRQQNGMEATASMVSSISAASALGFS